MSSQPNKVGLVVDRDFGERIPEIARAYHVWVVDSPSNTPIVQTYWRMEHSEPEEDPLESGVTSFKANEEESAQEVCARIAGEVDEHHGEFAHDPPWSEIEVYGAMLDERLREVFEEIGATWFGHTQEGFICRR